MSEFLHNIIKRCGVYIPLLLCLFACKQTDTHLSSPSDTDPISKVRSDDTIRDTVTANNIRELETLIRSNRQINLLGKDYKVYGLEAYVLRIRNIHDLDIVGEETTTILGGSEATVLSVVKSNNITVQNVSLMSYPDTGRRCQGGVLDLYNLTNLSLTNVTIRGKGAVGLVAKEIQGLEMSHSEITGCTCMIFELENSHNCQFNNVLFHNNNVVMSVLGGFTEGAGDINFNQCQFVNNQPKLVGNPAFNFAYNSEEQPVIMTDCTFDNNKGFKWYVNQIKLIDTNIDTTDFED